MIKPKLPVCPRESGDDLYASFLEAYETEEEWSPVIFKSKELSVRFCPTFECSENETAPSRLTKLIDDSSSCPELRKVAESARKAASTNAHKPHGVAEHIIGMCASILGIAILSGLVVAVLCVSAIVIGVLVPFELI
jgi:hypothetical protein